MNDFSPTAALRALADAQWDALTGAADLLRDELPGLLEIIEDHVVLSVAGTSRSVYGWFLRDAWRVDDRWVHEIFINANLDEPTFSREGIAQQLLTTLLHEAVHCYGYANGVKTTSRQGRYHGLRFAELAARSKLDVVPRPPHGFATPGLSLEGQALFAPLLENLRDKLVVTRSPRAVLAPISVAGFVDPTQAEAESVPDGAGLPAVARGRYIFVSCRCPAHRRGTFVTMRVNQSSWAEQLVCTRCGQTFRPTTTVDESLSTGAVRISRKGASTGPT